MHGLDDMVVAFKGYDAQLHEGLTVARMYQAARWPPHADWFSLLSCLGGSVWGFDGAGIDDKREAVLRGVEAIRDFINNTLQPKGVDFGYYFRLELSVKGPNALSHAIETLQHQFGLGGSVEDLTRWGSVVRRDKVAELAAELLYTWASPLTGFLEQVAMVAKTGNPVLRVGNLAEKAELAALCEAFLLMFPTGNSQRSTRHASLLGTRKGVLSLLNHDLLIKTTQAESTSGNEGQPLCTRVVGITPGALGEGVLGRAVLASDFTHRKRRIHDNVSSTLRGVGKLSGWGADGPRIFADLLLCSEVVVGMFIKETEQGVREVKVSSRTTLTGDWMPVAAHVANLRPCSENRVGTRDIREKPAHTFLVEHAFPDWAGSGSVDRNKVSSFSPSLAVHLDVLSKLTGDFMKETSSVSANNLLACLYVDAMVRLVRDSLGSEEFVLVLPALRPLGSADALPSSKWHTKGLFREVCPAEAMRLVDRLSSRIPVGGGWDQIAGVWAELDVCAEVTAVRDRSGGSVPMSGSHTMSVMKRTLKEEAGLALATKDHPLTSFEVARLFVGLFHLGWRHGHSDRTLWVRLAFSEELGFRKRRCSKDLSGAVSGQHRARWATHVLECIGELTDTFEELAGSSWPSDAGLRQAEELLAGNMSSKVWEKFQEAVTAEPGSLFKRTSWGLRSQEALRLVAEALVSLWDCPAAREAAFPGGMVPKARIFVLSAVAKSGNPPGRTTFVQDAFHDEEVRRALELDHGNFTCPSGTEDCLRCLDVRTMFSEEQAASAPMGSTRRRAAPALSGGSAPGSRPTDRPAGPPRTPRPRVPRGDEVGLSDASSEVDTSAGPSTQDGNATQPAGASSYPPLASLSEGFTPGLGRQRGVANAGRGRHACPPSRTSASQLSTTPDATYSSVGWEREVASAGARREGGSSTLSSSSPGSSSSSPGVVAGSRVRSEEAKTPLQGWQPPVGSCRSSRDAGSSSSSSSSGAPSTPRVWSNEAKPLCRGWLSAVGPSTTMRAI
eukprot:g14976.t1